MKTLTASHAPPLAGQPRPADDVPGPPQGCWTARDHATLPDDGHRYEIINGVLYMTPAPGTAHQASNTLIATYLTMYVQFPGRGRGFAAPCDVQLAEDRVVQPDVLVVLNERRDIITPERIVGAPDLVVEIASQRTASYDRSEKQQGYALAGVPEYWIADPHAHTAEVLVLETASGENGAGDDEGAAYRSLGVFRGSETLPSRVVPDFPVRVEQFFL